MIGPRSGNRVAMRMVKVGRGRYPVLLFAKASRERGALRKMPVDDELKRAAFGVLLGFAALMIVALVVASLRGRI